MNRYIRQIALKEIGLHGQQKISAAKVLIVGAGGLGHPVAQYLAAQGVGTIGLVDGDLVQESNLHRQVLFSNQDIGQNKASVLAKKIKSLNPEINIQFYDKYLDKKLALLLFQDFDIIVDGTDNFSTKFLINDVCCFYNKPMVYGAISQFEGQVGIFWNMYGVCYRCLYLKPPVTKIQNCAEEGVLGVLPGIIGCLQALEVIKLIILKEEEILEKTLVSRIQVYNFLNSEQYTLKVPKNNECFHHFENPDVIREIDTPVCVWGHETKLIDVRETHEWEEFHIQNSIHVPMSLIEATPQVIENLIQKDQSYTLICKSGSRAEMVYQILKSKGYQNIFFTKVGVHEYKI